MVSYSYFVPEMKENGMQVCMNGYRTSLVHDVSHSFSGCKDLKHRDGEIIDVFFTNILFIPSIK